MPTTATHRASIPTGADGDADTDHQAASSTRAVVVVDTSALISDPDAVLGYPGCDIVLPVTVIEELDGLKSRSDEQGAAARAALRTIDQIRTDDGGALDGGGTLHVEINGRHTEPLVRAGLPLDKADNLILACALGQSRLPGRHVTLVSHDVALRVKAEAFGLQAEERTPVLPAAVLDAGWETVAVSSATVDALYSGGSLPTEQLKQDSRDGQPGPMPDNRFLVLRGDGSSSALARVLGGELGVLASAAPRSWGLTPRSKEQRFALELLFDPQVPVVSLVGPAGTGKTLLALAAGLEQTLNAREGYRSVGVYRPIVGVGRNDLGHLPGELADKLDPWTAPITDALAALSPGRSRREVETQRDNLVNKGQLEFGSIQHVRGRSITESWIVIDEAQNLEVSTAKALLTRVGQGSKIIFCGDVSQIDSPWLSSTNNGLTATIAALAGQREFGHIRLTQGERSPVAELAAKLM